MVVVAESERIMRAFAAYSNWRRCAGFIEDGLHAAPESPGRVGGAVAWQSFSGSGLGSGDVAYADCEGWMAIDHSNC